MPKKSKQELKEELIATILEKDQAARKLIKLDKSKGYYLERASYDWPDDSNSFNSADMVRIAPQVPVIGQVIQPGIRLRTGTGVKAVITSEQSWILDADSDSDAIPLKDTEVNNFADAIVVEVELKVTRVFRAHDLKEIVMKPETPTAEAKTSEDWNTING